MTTRNAFQNPIHIKKTYEAISIALLSDRSAISTKNSEDQHFWALNPANVEVVASSLVTTLFQNQKAKTKRPQKWKLVEQCKKTWQHSIVHFSGKWYSPVRIDTHCGCCRSCYCTKLWSKWKEWTPQIKRSTCSTSENMSCRKSQAAV